MFCTNCGTPRPPGATSCPNCAQPYVAPPEISNYLVPAILITLCCCLPFGIVAIVYSAQVSSKLATGDVAGAQAASRKARWWCWVGFLTGILASAVSAVVVALQ